jgi:hypothetical protein
VNTYAKIVSGAFTRFVVEFRGFYSRISYSATSLKCVSRVIKPGKAF